MHFKIFFIISHMYYTTSQSPVTSLKSLAVCICEKLELYHREVKTKNALQAKGP